MPTVRLGILLALTPGIAVPAVSQNKGTDDLSSMEMQGKVGPYTIGLNYTVRHETELLAAHYFYATTLKDIPLTGTVNGQSVQLQGADGSTLHLHFLGNGSNGAAPLSFYTSVGLAGEWTLNGRTLPVRLTGAYGTANPGERMYALITDQPDAVVEARIQAARRAMLAEDRHAAAQYVHFPLRVNVGKQHLTVRNAQEFEGNWSKIFTPAMLAVLRGSVPHEMFCRDLGIMLASGEFWFDEKGLTSVNVH
jgi:hypothetical protein